MKHGICCVPVSSIRKEPSHRSEIVTQGLFGEFFQIMEVGADEWTQVKGCYDGYEGWMPGSHLSIAPEEENIREEIILSHDLWGKVSYQNENMYIPLGSNLNLPEWFIEKHAFNYGGRKWEPKNVQVTASTIRSVAFSFINTSYLWGGKSVFGIDCSGYAQLVFKFLNTQLLRDASLQAKQGTDVRFLQESVCGDLAFFDNASGHITHVGILLNDQTIIHASGKVRVDDIDSTGIINRDTKERTHQLRMIKRML